MSDVLEQRFDKFVDGEYTADELQQELIALCRGTPDSAWQTLALLDRYYRQHKISDELCRDLRAKIGEHAMRLEGHTVETASAELPQARPATAVSDVAMAVQTEPRRAPQYKAEVRHRGGYRLPMPDPEPSFPLRGAGSHAPPDEPDSLPNERVEKLLTQPIRTVKREQPKPEQPKPEQPPQPSHWFRWRRGFQTSPALGLVAVVLGVAASTRVRDPPEEIQPITPTVQEAPQPTNVEPAQHGPAMLSLGSDRYLVYPNQKTLELTVERSAGSGGDSTFTWWTQSSGAKASEDFIGTRAQVTAIPDGANSTTLRIPILANPHRHHIEMFYVAIGKPGDGAELGAIHRAAVFIFPSGKP